MHVLLIIKENDDTFFQEECDHMITLMSKNISSFFINKEIIQIEDREIYEYCFEILLSTLICITTLIIMAIISNTIAYTSLFFAGFIPLRLVAGGYHAKTHFRCYVLLMVTYSMFILSLYMIPVEHLTYFVIPCAIVSVILIFIFAPSADKNKPISAKDLQRFRIISRIIAIICIILVNGLVVFVPDKKIALSLTLGVLTIGISLLANKIKYTRDRNINAVSREEEGQYEEV